MDVVKLIDPVQDPRWDEFVMKHHYGLICHLSGWKQVLESSFKHMKGYYFALIDKNNKIKAGLPIFNLKSWIIGNRLVSIPFSTLCDPLITNREEIEALFQAVFDLSKKLKSSYIEIKTLSSYSLISDSQFKNVNNFKHHYLSLETELSGLKRAFHRKTRYNINRSMKSGLIVRAAEEDLDLFNFYKLYISTRKHIGLPPQPLIFFKMLCELLSSSNRGILLLAEKDGQLVAGGIFLKFKNRFSDEYRAWDRRFNSLRPNYYLYWEAIKLAHSEGYKIFDFGRTSRFNKGLMDFKGRWGTKIMDLPQFYYPERMCRKYGEREKSFSYKAINSISKKVPDPIFKLLGDFIYCHMG